MDHWSLKYMVKVIVEVNLLVAFLKRKLDEGKMLNYSKRVSECDKL